LPVSSMRLIHAVQCRHAFVPCWHRRMHQYAEAVAGLRDVPPGYLLCTLRVPAMYLEGPRLAATDDIHAPPRRGAAPPRRG
jgi:hypothetical protein